MLLFDESNNWNTERRARALELMDKYIAKNAKPSSYITTWTRHGAPKKATAEETWAYRMEVAADKERFTNALFAFYCCLTTDLSFLDPLVKGMR